jgi:hypothetical protein
LIKLPPDSFINNVTTTATTTKKESVMNTIIEQLVIKELQSLVTSGKVEEVIATLVGYLEKVEPEVAKLWTAALAELQSKLASVS